MSIAHPSRRHPRLTRTAAAAALSLALLSIPTAASATTLVSPTPLRTTTTHAPDLASTSRQPDHRPALDEPALRKSLQAFHDAGMYGAYSAVRDGSDAWQGAVGVADIDTGRRTSPQMEHRIGSITKTFTAVAVLQEVGKGHLALDAPIGRYLPDLVTGERGRTITVRMLLNHTSGIGEYSGAIFNTADSFEGNRFHQFAPEELARLGIAAPPFGTPGQGFHYSNTNYVLAGLLLRKVTGQSPESYITSHVIRKAGLRHTYFPQSATISGPHAKMYEAAYGGFTPPRDFSVYNMSWAATAGSLISTMPDLNRFYRALLGGELLAPAELRQMKTTVPMEGSFMRYGLGLLQTTSACGDFWGHNGLVLGAMTWSLSSPDGRRQVSLGFNLTRYQQLDANNQPVASPIDDAMNDYIAQAACGTTKNTGPGATSERPLTAPAPTDQNLTSPRHPAR
ncbi:serine hydrolase domain-containing protein [Streptomyces lunalinharesii]|uniref:Serine hydrolase domain-containing protein n=1 Tax=Streptomyces lunalinharesii TaxID=333384 RepID=A0ABP6ERJ5_9ACTN